MHSPQSVLIAPSTIAQAGPVEQPYCANGVTLAVALPQIRRSQVGATNCESLATRPAIGGIRLTVPQIKGG